MNENKLNEEMVTPVQIVVTYKEKKMIEEAADKDHRSVSSFCKAAAFEKIKRMTDEDTKTI